MKKESYLKSKENEAVRRINFFSDKNTLTVFFLPVFTIPKLMPLATILHRNLLKQFSHFEFCYVGNSQNLQK